VLGVDVRELDGAGGSGGLGGSSGRGACRVFGSAARGGHRGAEQSSRGRSPEPPRPRGPLDKAAGTSIEDNRDCPTGEVKTAGAHDLRRGFKILVVTASSVCQHVAVPPSERHSSRPAADLLGL
jgi:hypothetical protein